MSKYSIVLIILVSACVSLSGQEYFGLRAGLSITTFTGDNAGSNTPRVGLHAGLTNQIHVHPNIVLQPELLYSMRGASSSYSLAGLETVVTDKLDYLELPLALKANIQTYHLQLQPYLAGELRYLLSQKRTTETKAGSSSSVSTTDLAIYRDWDYGMAFGMDLFINETIELGMRYNIGMADIVKTTGLGATPDIKNYGLMISLGVLY